MTCPVRLGRLMALQAVATRWMLTTAPPDARDAPRQPWRPREAMDGVFRLGRAILRGADARTSTPPCTWVLTGWDAPCWTDQCLAAKASPP